MIFPTVVKLIINACIFYVFLGRPFGVDGKDRFIW
jgi:hypothetical protein